MNFKCNSDILYVCELIHYGVSRDTIIDALVNEKGYSESEVETFPQIDSLIKNFHQKQTIQIASRLIQSLIPIIPIYDIDRTVTHIQVYSFDRMCYTYNDNIIHQALIRLHPILGHQSRAKTIIIDQLKSDLSLYGSSRDSLKLESLTWIKAQNGLVNVYTKELIPYSPDVVITSHTETLYDPSVHNTVISDILFTFVDKNPERFVLAKQILLTAMMGERLGDVIIWILGGGGGSGKSIFSQLIVAMIKGDVQPNHLVANVPFSLLDNPTEAEKLLHAQVVVGDDVNDKDFMRKTRVLKSLSSGNIVNLNLKYDKQTTPLRFLGPLIQNTPTLPRITEESNQISRRAVVLKATHDFTKDRERLTSKELIAAFCNPINRSAFLNQLVAEAPSLLADRSYNQVDHSEVVEMTTLNDPKQYFIEVLKELNIPSGTVLPNELFRCIYLDSLDIPITSTKAISQKSFTSMVLRELQELKLVEILPTRKDLSVLSYKEYFTSFDGKETTAFLSKMEYYHNSGQRKQHPCSVIL